MNNPPIGTCGENEVAYKCPLGGQLAVDMQDQTVARWTFEVVAELDERTNGTGTEPETTQCTQGQYVQGTRKTDGNGTDNPPTVDEPPAGSINLGGFHFHAVGKGVRYPKFGSFDYRADDYTAPWQNKEHEPKVFRWLDDPGGPVGTESRTQRDQFIAFVDGNLGTCVCQFEIVQKWKAGVA